MWISPQALLSHELDFAFIDSNTIFDDRLTVRPAFREPFLLLSPPDSHYPEEVDPASLDIAEELLVTWDPEFIRWHDRWFGTGARPLLYADTYRRRISCRPPRAAGWRPGHRRRVAHREERTSMPLYQPAAGPGELSGDASGRTADAAGPAIFAGVEGPPVGAGQCAGVPVKKNGGNGKKTP